MNALEIGMSNSCIVIMRIVVVSHFSFSRIYFISIRSVSHEKSVALISTIRSAGKGNLFKYFFLGFIPFSTVQPWHHRYKYKDSWECATYSLTV